MSPRTPTLTATTLSPLPPSSHVLSLALPSSAFPDVPTHTNAPASVEMRPARRIVPQAQVAQHQGGFDDIAGISATDITAEVVPEATPYGGYPVLHAPADKYGPSGVAATHARPSSADHFGPSGVSPTHGDRSLT
uniref:Uncharacterized protein n=1 Tax=Phaeomonas parva TaxID=124430 RepID=A0A6U4G142_9STRA|mmetsp:Transcript_28393/g.90849  ORF Transcript_28393/g.90849 Transcript_28393/m.90849 type:complete len:135 (+) Transcript_28393:379-783(+)